MPTVEIYLGIESSEHRAAAIQPSACVQLSEK